MAEKTTIGDLIHRASKEGLELSLWHGRVMWRRSPKVSPLVKAELMRRAGELRVAMLKEMVAEREKQGLPHKWVIRLGDPARLKPGDLSEKCRPALLACGPSVWYMRMIRQAQEFGDENEKRRWLILEQDQVGAYVRDDRGVLVASLLKLPEGCQLGGPEGSQAEIVSACDDCLEPPIDEGKVKEMLKNDE